MVLVLVGCTNNNEGISLVVSDLVVKEGEVTGLVFETKDGNSIVSINVETEIIEGEEYIELDENYNVTAKEIGKAIVRISIPDTTTSADIEVRVIENLTSEFKLVVAESTLKHSVGKTIDFSKVFKIYKDNKLVIFRRDWIQNEYDYNTVGEYLVTVAYTPAEGYAPIEHTFTIIVEEDSSN
jgi:hypothetical protein